MQPMSKDQLKKEWEWNLTNHTPTPEGIEKIEKLREAGKAYVNAMLDLCPTSRDLSLALTCVEEGSMHAIASIARSETNDVKEQ